MQRAIIRTTVLAIALMAMASFAAAAVPQVINYQGRLTDASGTPLDTAVSMTFAIYDDSTAGTLGWSESHDPVVVTNGLFSVLLGSVNPIHDTVFNGPNRWLQVTVGGSAMEPRTRLVTVPYAFRVSTVDSAFGGTIHNDLEVSGHVGVETNPSLTYALNVGGDVKIDTNLWVENGKIDIVPSGHAVPVGYKLYVLGNVRTDSVLEATEGIKTGDGASGDGIRFGKKFFSTFGGPDSVLIAECYSGELWFRWNGTTRELLLHETNAGNDYCHWLVGRSDTTTSAIIWANSFIGLGGWKLLAGFPSNGQCAIVYITSERSDGGFVHLHCMWSNDKFIAHYSYRYQ
jgi:hypothetical protein